MSTKHPERTGPRLYLLRLLAALSLASLFAGFAPTASAGQVAQAPAPNHVEISRYSTTIAGELVYLRVAYTGNLRTFGFVGIDGSNWTAESLTVDSPSYGEIDQGGAGGAVTYPFNHGCGTGSAYESDLRFWVAGADEQRDYVDVHLSCTPIKSTPHRFD
jgi:hypothetical protein